MVRTSVGTVRIEWRRLRCLNCGQTVILLPEPLQLKRYQSKTAELEPIVAEGDRARIEGATDEAEEKVGQLAQELAQKGYRQAASYVENGKDRLFSYVRFWLRYGLVSPRVSSMIERMMREIGRRLKRIAFGWSDEGAAKMARIIIKRITSANEWEAYWKERLRITGNVVLVYGGIKAM